MSDLEDKVPGLDKDKKTISYDYIKSNQFRVIHADGVWGGLSPRFGFIHMGIFSERWPIPKRTVSKLKDDGSVGEEIFEERIFRNAVVREVESQIVISIDVAKKIRDWLIDKIELYEKTIEKKNNLK